MIPYPNPSLFFQNLSVSRLFKSQPASTPAKRTFSQVEDESVNEGGFKYVGPIKATSTAVWKYFGFKQYPGKLVNRKEVFCKVCGKKFNYHSSTSSMKAHLKVHPEVRPNLVIIIFIYNPLNSPYQCFIINLG